MKLRISFCNKTLLRKNISRFAPIWGLYQISLLIGLGLMYMEANNGIINFWFASYMAQCIQLMGLVNLFFAPAVASLLFGDLFSPRMCNALHAMPLRRETLFVTNVVSGLLFSLVPTAVMALLSIPLLLGTVVHNAWQIAILWFVGVNLEFVCFFGMAVFCIFCTGNRLGFTALYAVLNGGAFLIFAIVDMLYTPMLYGVITPDRVCIALTPIANMVDDVFVEVANYHNMLQIFDGRLNEAVADFWVDENYYSLFGFALVGIVFMALGLVMYRRRNLECAGDAVAVRWLAPVFQIIAAVVGAAAAVLGMEMFFYSLMRDHEAVAYILTFCGLTVGWFGGKMLLERNTQVFRLKNWTGLGILAAIFAVTLTMTRFDVMGIETRLPDVQKVKFVTVSANGEMELTEQEEIEQIIRLQELALEDRLEDSGMYPAFYVEANGRSHITMPEDGFSWEDYDRMEHHYYADWVYITYTMENGREIQRRYVIWASFEEGEILKEYGSRWENVWEQARMGYENEPDLEKVWDVSLNGKRFPEELRTAEKLRELLDAVRADCEERTMYQDNYYHNGRFVIPNESEYADTEPYYYESSLYLDITTFTGNAKDTTGIWLQIFPDSRHSLQWLLDHDLMPYEIIPENVR